MKSLAVGFWGGMKNYDEKILAQRESGAQICVIVIYGLPQSARAEP